MALSHAILVSLLEQPMTGYDLAKQFDISIGHFWRATHQQIYQELAKLDAQGSIRPTVVEQQARPNRIVYSVTEAGRRHLLDWAVVPSAPGQIKEDLLVKCCALGVLPREALHAQILERRNAHRAKLDLFLKIKERVFPDPDRLHDAALGRYLSLAAGIVYERGWVKWCDESLKLLAP